MCRPAISPYKISETATHLERPLDRMYHGSTAVLVRTTTVGVVVADLWKQSTEAEIPDPAGCFCSCDSARAENGALHTTNLTGPSARAQASGLRGPRG